MLSSSFTPAMIGWLAACVVFVAVEALTTGLTSVWFALGSLAGLICAMLDAPLWLQLLSFLLISVAALLFTRPLVKKYVNSRKKATNADSCVGKTALVTERIDNLAGTGAVKLDGKIWTARTLSGAAAVAGETVLVREIRGVKLMVEKTEQTCAASSPSCRQNV